MSRIMGCIYFVDRFFFFFFLFFSSPLCASLLLFHPTLLPGNDTGALSPDRGRSSPSFISGLCLLPGVLGRKKLFLARL